MPRKLLFTLLVSITAHIAAVAALDQQKEEQQTLSMGAIQAPVSLSFSTVSQPQPEPLIKEPVKKPEPKSKPEPKPEPLEAAKPVLKKPEPRPEPEPEPIKDKPVEPSEPEQFEEKTPEPPAEPVMEKSVLEASEVDGLSNDPIMVTEPTIRNWVEPRYPRIARRRNQQGVVMLDVVVDEKGNPEKVAVLETSGFVTLDNAAISAVNRWNFEPQRRNNIYVKSRVHIPVAFELN